MAPTLAGSTAAVLDLAQERARPSRENRDATGKINVHHAFSRSIRTGFFKTRTGADDGRDQVTGFQTAGELLGLDGISTDRDHGVMLLLGSMRAEERLASFLLNLTKRLQARGFSASELVLRMTREEIGSYLGLKLETVSRTFSKFQDDGILEVRQRQIRILDPQALQELLSPSDSDCR